MRRGETHREIEKNSKSLQILVRGRRGKKKKEKNSLTPGMDPPYG